MIALFFLALIAFVLVLVLALCKNARSLDEKEWRELERDLDIKHLEDFNR